MNLQIPMYLQCKSMQIPMHLQMHCRWESSSSTKHTHSFGIMLYCRNVNAELRKTINVGRRALEKLNFKAQHCHLAEAITCRIITVGTRVITDPNSTASSSGHINLVLPDY